MINWIKNYKEEIIGTIILILIPIIIIITVVYILIFWGSRTYTVIKEQEIYVEVKDSGLQVKKTEYSLYDKEKDTIYIIYSDDKIVVKNDKCLIDISDYKVVKTIKNVTDKGEKINELG